MTFLALPAKRLHHFAFSNVKHHEAAFVTVGGQGRFENDDVLSLCTFQQSRLATRPAPGRK